MVIVALAWGFTAILDQSAVQYIPPALHALILAVGMFIIGAARLLSSQSKRKGHLPRSSHRGCLNRGDDGYRNGRSIRSIYAD